jgi:hypothetical protein
LQTLTNTLVGVWGERSSTRIDFDKSSHQLERLDEMPSKAFDKLWQLLAVKVISADDSRGSVPSFVSKLRGDTLSNLRFPS